MGIDEDYHDNIKRENTHPTLLPQKAQECRISDKTREVLHKAVAICTLLAATKTSLPDVQRNMQAAVAVLILMKSMTRGTQKLPSHCRSVLGDKGYASPLERRMTDRRAQIKKVQIIDLHDRIRKIRVTALSLENKML
eukprot:8102369-Ditylum_brightwellii.AAC.1